MANKSFPVIVLITELGVVNTDALSFVFAAIPFPSNRNIECGAVGLGSVNISKGARIGCRDVAPGEIVEVLDGDSVAAQKVRTTKGQMIYIAQPDYLNFINHCNSCCVGVEEEE